MKKVLKIITVVAGIISTVSAILLGCLYLDDIIRFAEKIKTKFIKQKDGVGIK